MTPRRYLPRRALTEWRGRGGLALLATALCYVGVAHSFAHVVARADPARAHALAPWDGRLTAALAEKRFIDDQVPAAQPETAQLARLALRQYPMAVGAVATLGLQAQVRGDRARARRLFGYSQTLSRRDLQTQLWAIEDAVARNDIPGALHHYDVALRMNNQAADLLFPVLTAAMTQSEVRDALVATLAQRPRWGEYFVNHATFYGTDPHANLQLLRALKRIAWDAPESARSSLVNALVNAGATDDAWSYYASVRKGADRGQSRDPDFSAGIDIPSVLDWVVNAGDASGSIQRAAQGGVFDFAAPPSAGGLLLQQLQLLPPGRYRIEGHSRGIEQPERSLPYWTLTCRDGRELGRVPVSNSTQSRGTFTGQFNVPANCPIQTLAFVVRPSDEISGVSGQIDRVQLFATG